MVARHGQEEQYLTSEDFIELLDKIFGEGGQSRFARISGISRSQINRYARGDAPVPKYVAFMVELCLEFKRSGIPLPEPQPLPKSRPMPRPASRRPGRPSRAAAL